MPDFPSLASPAFGAAKAPHHDKTVSDLDLDADFSSSSAAPPPLVSPAATPPHTPSADGQRHDRLPKSVPPEQSSGEADNGAPKLLETLPEVQCEVRARIPTTTGQEMFLHLYHNNADNKEQELKSQLDV